MLNPTRVLQLALASVLLTGCASQHTAATATNATTAGSPTQPKAAETPAGRNYPPIRAGQSTPGAAPWVLPDGRLTPDVQSYAREVAQTRAIPESHVTTLLRQAQYNAEAARLMSPSATRIKRSWVTYRRRFVDPVRMRAGESFWRTHRSTLDQAAETYGVPASVIVAIIGVETVYGRYTGNFSVLDALATLGFRYPDPSRPERSQLFRDQLADFIQLDYEGALNARQTTGSFAGAMGLPQFMPGSLMRYAADGDADGRIDLHASTTDAIHSVARFLRLHGWVPGLPVFAPVQLPADPARLVAGGLEPTLTWEALQQAGAKAGTDGRWQTYKLGIVNLVDEPRGTVEYRTATPNFFAITHYNRSYFYAASVADLAHALAKKMNTPPVN